MDKFWEIDKDVQINSNCDDEIPSSILDMTIQSEFMNSFEFPSFNDPNHAAFRSYQTVIEDVNYLLSSLINENVPDYTQINQEPSQTSLNDSLISESVPDIDGTSLILAAYLLNSFLKQEDVELLDERIMSMTDAFPDSEWRPRFIFSNFEAGYWIVKCADELSKRWFLEQISEIPIWVGNIQTRLVAVPIKNLPTFKSEVFIKGQIINDDKVLARFAKQNKEIELSTSRWTELKCLPVASNAYKLSCEIDLLSYERIKANGFELFFGMETVKFKIQDKLEAAAVDIISMEQEGMTY